MNAGARARGRRGARARRRRAPGRARPTCRRRRGSTAKTGCAERPGRALEARGGAASRGRRITFVRPSDQQDGRDVEQQHVLDHVHRRRPARRGGRRGHQRDQDAGQAGQETPRRASLGGVACPASELHRAEAAHVRVAGRYCLRSRPATRTCAASARSAPSRARSPSRAGAPRRFLAGLACVLIALVSPVDRLAEQIMTMHMVQHLLLLDLAPVLLPPRPDRC